jgi:formylmethanofuran:tetrahydromethanopterin formyltransferase
VQHIFIKKEKFMKKKELYERPEIVVIEFVIEDSIAASGAIGGEQFWTPGD